jgi:two-component system OmpR family response regulator
MLALGLGRPEQGQRTEHMNTEGGTDGMATDRRSRILVVEDDPVLRQTLEGVLEAGSYEVLTLAHGFRIDEARQFFRPDLVVMDVDLGVGPDGFSLAKRMHDSGDVPVIFVTGATDEAARLEGFNAGADDYLVKPFSIPELLARIQAVLRRAGREISASWQVADLVVDEAARTAVRHDTSIDLTRTEFEILVALHKHLGQVVSKGDLLGTVWGFDAYDHNVVEVHVSSLRRKLELSGPRLIHTVRGSGYVLRG